MNVAGNPGAPVVSNRRLGKKPPMFDSRTLRLASYVQKRTLPKIPRTHTLSVKTLRAFPNLGLMLNDRLGDCTCAAAGHALQTWSVYGGAPQRPTDTEIREAYNRVNGGMDEGAVMLDVLKMWRNIGIGGNKIAAFVSVDPTDEDQVRTAHFLFGGLYVGANLPVSAQDQLNGGVWEVTDGPAAAVGSWGGHCINIVDTGIKTLTAVTWGQLQKMTWAWLRRYVDEAYAVLDASYLGADARSPQGFSMTKLLADLRAL